MDEGYILDKWNLKKKKTLNPVLRSLFLVWNTVEADV